MNDYFSGSSINETQMLYEALRGSTRLYEALRGSTLSSEELNIISLLM